MSDTFRAVVAGLVSTVLALPVIVVAFPVVGSDDVRSQALGLGGGMVYLACYQLVYQAITWRTLRRPDAALLRHWAIASRPRTRTQRRVQFWLGSGAINWAVSAATLALLAVVAVASRGFSGDPVLLTIAVVTVVVSWSMVAFAFSVAYLRENAANGGLDFPGEDRDLVWSDYLYLACQISTTFAGSDVAITNSRMRRVVTVHSLLAFVFNTGILAIFVSILIGI